MEVLVDSSVWIDYFRTGADSHDLEYLIDENLIVINDIILSELIPYLRLRRQTRVIDLLLELTRAPLNIDWSEIIDYQLKCLESGANGVGIPDLIIAQNTIQNDLKIYSHDKHFKLLNQVLGLDIYPPRTN